MQKQNLRMKWFRARRSKMGQRTSPFFSRRKRGSRIHSHNSSFITKSFSLSNGRFSRVVWISFRKPEVCNQESLCSTTPETKERDAVSAASTAAWRVTLATDLLSLVKDLNLACLSSRREI